MVGENRAGATLRPLSPGTAEGSRTVASRLAHALAVCLVLALFFSASPTLAQSAEPASPDRAASPGINENALPGLLTVGIPTRSESALGVALTLGYGYLEALPGESGSHHRLRGLVAASYAFTPVWAVALAVDGRYDQHPEDEIGKDDSFVGDPNLLVRFSPGPLAGLHLGGELGVWVPGEKAPSVKLGATTVDARSLLGWSDSSGNLWFGSHLGFRFDNSAKAAPALESLRPGDRTSLGLSDFHSASIGLGVARRWGRTTLLGELTASPLLGSGAPPLTTSPLRLNVGGRQALSPNLTLELSARISLSSRPSLDPNTPLIPIEPRAQFLAGIRYGDRAHVPNSTRRTTPKPIAETKPAKPVLPTSFTLGGVVTDEARRPVAEAVVRYRFTPEAPLSGGHDAAPATAGGTVPKPEGTASSDPIALDAATRETVTGNDGSFELGTFGEGSLILEVEANGYRPFTATYPVGPSHPLRLSIALAALPPMGQLRGLVRSFSGAPIPAAIRVDPTGLEIKADESGYFEVDVPPGQYEVIVTAPGFAEQRRTVTVERDGVTVLNADMIKGRK